MDRRSLRKYPESPVLWDSGKAIPWTIARWKNDRTIAWGKKREVLFLKDGWKITYILPANDRLLKRNKKCRNDRLEKRKTGLGRRLTLNDRSLIFVVNDHFMKKCKKSYERSLGGKIKTRLGRRLKLNKYHHERSLSKYIYIYCRNNRLKKQERHVLEHGWKITMNISLSEINKNTHINDRLQNDLEDPYWKMITIKDRSTKKKTYEWWLMEKSLNPVRKTTEQLYHERSLAENKQKTVKWSLK